MKKIRVITLLLVCLSISASAMASDQTIRSKWLHFDKMKFVFAPAKHGSVYVHDFAFTNIGRKTINILKVSTGCGCTVVKYTTTPIPQGGKGIIRVIYKSGTQSKGYFKRFANILTNREVARIQIEGITK